MLMDSEGLKFRQGIVGTTCMCSTMSVVSEDSKVCVERRLELSQASLIHMSGH